MSDDSTSLSITVELEPQSEPIRGTVREPDGHARTYVGWLALIAALDDIRTAHAKGHPCAAR
jgi:hypothetical protein